MTASQCAELRFCNQFLYSPGKISERIKHKNDPRWLDPAQRTFLERVKAEANSLLDGDDQMKCQKLEQISQVASTGRMAYSLTLRARSYTLTNRVASTLRKQLVRGKNISYFPYIS